MTLLRVDVLSPFARKYPPARKSTDKWRQVVELARWSNFADVKATFSTASHVAPNVVFNIGGNKYRIVTVINYGLRLVQIEHAFTHEQYNDWKP